MTLRHLSPEEYQVSHWAGGTTAQIAIFPTTASYQRRNFLWRLSSATVELDTSDFTLLPDFHRFLSVLEGEMRLRHNGGEEIVLIPGRIHAFDGGDDTRSEGRCTDFNLITRKGACHGRLEALTPQPGEEITLVVPQPDAQLLIYCRRGFCRLEGGGTRLELTAGHSALAEQLAGEALCLTGQGELLSAAMWTVQPPTP